MNSETLNIAIIQFDPVWEETDQNLLLLSSMMEQIEYPVDIVVLPEAFASGFSMNADKIAQEMDGIIVSWMQNIAKEKNTAICGSVFIRDANCFFNRFIWITPQGNISTYDKRHLFSLGGENNNYSNGNKKLIIEYKGWRLFPQICYDLRFPVWSRNVNNYDVLINTANWPAARKNVWKTLLKARAIENQCYVLGANRFGTDGNGINHHGHSTAIDFKGVTLMNAKQQSGVFITRLDLSELKSFRKKFDTLKDADKFTIIDD